MNPSRNLKFLFILIALFHCNNKSNIQALRIVSLSPAMTEIIFALGADKYLVGVTTFCNYPESAKNIYKVGDFSHPSLERILAQKPSLVIVNLPEQTHIMKELKKLNIPLFISNPQSIEDIYKEIKKIGQIIKQYNQADSLINYMRKNLKPVDITKRKKIYIEISPRPLITVGRKSFLNELITLAGGENIFADIDKDYPIISQEEVIKRAPELIILLHPGKVEERLGWQKLEAVQKGRIFKNMNPDILLRPGPRLVQGYYQLKKVICE